MLKSRPTDFRTSKPPKPRRPWAVAGLVVSVVLSLALAASLVFAPDQIWTWLQSRGARFEAAGKLLAGLAFVLTLAVAWIRGRAAVRSAESSASTAEAALSNARLALKNTSLAEQAQTTERFTKAVEMLGNTESLRVRLGGIYTLESIARETSNDALHKVVFEVLCAFLRETRTPQKEGKDLGPMSEDVHVTLSVILRREPIPPGEVLDLHGADLREASLPHAHLKGANLRDANLEAADLYKAHLEAADLSGAHLEGARLIVANLERAFLTGAHLERADLDGAHLEEASLAEAHLQGAHLDGAHLEKAELHHAHLEGAYLGDATGLKPEQLAKAFGDSFTQLPPDMTRPPHWPDPDPNPSPP